MMPPSRRAPRGALQNGCTANLQALSNTALSVRFVQRTKRAQSHIQTRLPAAQLMCTAVSQGLL